MSKNLDIFLQTTSASFGWLAPEGYKLQALPVEGQAFGQALSELKTGPQLAGADVDLYLGEDLLFFTKITLPLQTPNIKTAIALQLDMLSPFGDDSLSTFASQRSKEGFVITLYFCRRSLITPLLEILSKAGAHLTGLYPESQRYLTRDTQKLVWSLWSPGRFGKITHFRHGKVISRDLCTQQANGALIQTRTGSPTLYTLGNAESGAASAMSLLAQPASVKEYNMLPASFLRPDYMKKAMVALVAINLVLLVLLGGFKGLVLHRQAAALDQHIAATKIDADEALTIKGQIKKYEKQLDDYRAMGTNIDLIAFMAGLNKNLPSSAYLDQFRFDGKTRTITLQGYTDDLPGLTENIAALGAATLKSTMKRRDQTYFHLEVSMP
ncbi:MAG: hypothetical protein KKD73_04490 [Proteobacteria bacterium]|nr:hypothetical protein [Pseudomonadota bacterium]MBU1639620.1 hypothetical protein [Pseudomonadota bacterium]